MVFSNIIIGGLIILACLVVFILMAALLVDTKKNTPSFEITFTDIDNADNVRAVHANLNSWAARVKMHDEEWQVNEAIVTTLQLKMVELEDAIDSENYEHAAILRDEINELNVELKKVTK